ncbi:MAG: cell division protein ZapA [Gammaproteobacteria bacterium]
MQAFDLYGEKLIMTSSNTLSLKIFGKDYQVKCTSENIQDLQQAAHYLDEKMREIQELHGSRSNENIAVMTALNLSHELFLAKKQEDKYIHNMSQRIQLLQEKIEAALVESTVDAA